MNNALIQIHHWRNLLYTTNHKARGKPKPLIGSALSMPRTRRSSVPKLPGLFTNRGLCAEPSTCSLTPVFSSMFYIACLTNAVSGSKIPIVYSYPIPLRQDLRTDTTKLLTRSRLTFLA